MTFSRRQLWLLALGILLGVMASLALLIGWISWSERNPEQERDLRILVQDRLHEWFPEQMSLPEDVFGFHPANQAGKNAPPAVILLHGLDEPGGIWDSLADALDQAEIAAWSFRYPNDQAIDQSADLLADAWPELDSKPAVTLIGHSMGGLVIRDFVTRHLAELLDREDDLSDAVSSVVMVGTPNQGSDWSRLRAWLEVRETFADLQQGRFSLFASLRDGTGAAKIDLRPDSAFLQGLNQREWPNQIPLKLIGGRLMEPGETIRQSVEMLAEELGDPSLRQDILEWWATASQQVGDGVVPVESLQIPGQAEPLLLEASHRGLLVRSPDQHSLPPAIPPILEWLGVEPETVPASVP